MSNQNSEIALQDQFEKFMAAKEASVPQPLEIVVVDETHSESGECVLSECNLPEIALQDPFDLQLMQMFENFLGSRPGCECGTDKHGFTKHSHWCLAGQWDANHGA